MAHGPCGMFVYELLLPGLWPLQFLPRVGQGLGQATVSSRAMPRRWIAMSMAPKQGVKWCKQQEEGVPTAMADVG